MSDAKIIGYIVRNRQTGKASSYVSGWKASDACDRADNAYGAICTSRVAVWSDDAERVAEFKAMRA